MLQNPPELLGFSEYLDAVDEEQKAVEDDFKMCACNQNRSTQKTSAERQFSEEEAKEFITLKLSFRNVRKTAGNILEIRRESLMIQMGAFMVIG